MFIIYVSMAGVVILNAHGVILADMAVWLHQSQQIAFRDYFRNSY